MGFLARNKCAVAVVSVVAIAVVVGIVLAVTLTQSSSTSEDKNVSYYKFYAQDINLISPKLFYDYANRREHSQLIMIAIHF